MVSIDDYRSTPGLDRFFSNSYTLTRAIYPDFYKKQSIEMTSGVLNERRNDHVCNASSELGFTKSTF